MNNKEFALRVAKAGKILAAHMRKHEGSLGTWDQKIALISEVIRYHPQDMIYLMTHFVEMNQKLGRKLAKKKIDNFFQDLKDKGHIEDFKFVEMDPWWNRRN